MIANFQNLMTVATAPATGMLAAGAMAVAAAVAVGFLFIFNEASYQKRAQRMAFTQYAPKTHTASAFHTALVNDNGVRVEIKAGEPVFAGEMLAVVRDLAARVMTGTADIAELLSMLDTLQRMGIDVQGLFGFLAPVMAAEMTEEAHLQQA